LRVIAVGLARKLERRLAQRVDLVGLFGQDPAAEIAALAGGELAPQLGFVRIGEDPGEGVGDLSRRFDQRRTVAERVRVVP
jgi:hypothetical protein